MKWMRERDALIAQTMAFVQSVTGKRPDLGQLVTESRRDARGACCCRRRHPRTSRRCSPTHRLRQKRRNRPRSRAPTSGVISSPRSAPVSPISARIRSVSAGSGKRLEAPPWPRSTPPCARVLCRRGWRNSRRSPFCLNGFSWRGPLSDTPESPFSRCRSSPAQAAGGSETRPDFRSSGSGRALS